MSHSEISINYVSETSLLIKLSDHIDITLVPALAEICRIIKKHYPDVIELTPSYTTILIEVKSVGVDIDRLADEIGKLVNHVLQDTSSRDLPCGKLIELPVYYDHSVGADLAMVAKFSELSIDEVIAIHSGKDYTACAIGFTPGFAFLAELDDRLVIPRRDSPRAKVSAGSVAIAENQTAVYPADSPGGWHLLGKCPLPLFDLSKAPMTPFSIGDQVRFSPIDRETFIKKGGIL